MGSVPPLLLIGTGIVMLGNLIHFIGLGTTHWQELSIKGYGYTLEGHSGIFRACDANECRDFEDKQLSSSLEATRAMVIMGMLAGMGGALLAILFVVFKLIGKTAPKLIVILSTVACFAAAGLIIIGVIIFGADVYDSDLGDLGYSFGLCIVAAVLLGIGGFLVFIGAKSVD